MTKQFPNPCCRCGFCCMAETCPTGALFHNVPKHGTCPAFDYDPVKMEATCQHASTGLVGIGLGCCMLARCFKDGVQYDFASLPVEMKKNVALSTWRKNHEP